MDDEQVRRHAEFMQALTTDHTALQSARSASISESSSRSAVYLTALSSAVVVLALVVQVSRLGPAFFVFAFAILPVVFFLGVVTFGRLLQTGVEDVIYARAISRIRSFYSEIDPSRAEYFAATSVDQVGLQAMGLWKMRWQQFLAAAATVAVVNSVVGGAFVALAMRGLLGASLWGVANGKHGPASLRPFHCRCGPAPAPARTPESCLGGRHLEKPERCALGIANDRKAPAREVHRRDQFFRAGLCRGLE